VFSLGAKQKSVFLFAFISDKYSILFCVVRDILQSQTFLKRKQAIHHHRLAKLFFARTNLLMLVCGVCSNTIGQWLIKIT